MVTEAKSQTDGAQTSSSVQTSLTQAQVDKMISDRLASAGRDAKALADQGTKLKAERAALDTERSNWERQRDEAEEARVKDDPDAFATFRQKRDVERREAVLRRKEEEIAARETAFAEREQTLTKSGRESLANAIGAELNVDSASLLKFTDGSEVAMRELAAQLPKKTAPASVIKPDSGATAGGVGVTTDNIDALHLEGKVSDAAYRAFLRTGQLG